MIFSFDEKLFTSADVFDAIRDLHYPEIDGSTLLVLETSARITACVEWRSILEVLSIELGHDGLIWHRQHHLAKFVVRDAPIARQIKDVKYHAVYLILV